MNAELRASTQRGLIQTRIAILLAIWIPFALFMLAAVSRSSVGAPWTTQALTLLFSISGPMTGAISRGFQPCCLQASLALMPYCALALGAAAALQMLPAETRLVRNGMLLAWAAGLTIWFGGGVLSLIHALS